MPSRIARTSSTTGSLFIVHPRRAIPMLITDVSRYTRRLIVDSAGRVAPSELPSDPTLDGTRTASMRRATFLVIPVGSEDGEDQGVARSDRSGRGASEGRRRSARRASRRRDGYRQCQRQQQSRVARGPRQEGRLVGRVSVSRQPLEEKLGPLSEEVGLRLRACPAARHATRCTPRRRLRCARSWSRPSRGTCTVAAGPRSHHSRPRPSG